MKFNTLISSRIVHHRALANTPRPIVEAVCLEMLNEIADSCSSAMTAYDMCESVDPCDLCSEIFVTEHLTHTDPSDDNSPRICQSCRDDMGQPAPKTLPVTPNLDTL